MRSHDSSSAFLDWLPDWTQGLRHSQCSRWHTQNAVCRCPVAEQSYPLFGFSLTVCRYFHILSTCYEPVWQILGLKELMCKIKYFCLTCLFTKQYVAYGEIGHFLCSVISQGKVVALDRWGGKWNHFSMTHRLTTNYAKNYCNRTLKLL